MEHIAYKKRDCIYSKNRITGIISFSKLRKKELDKNVEKNRFKKVSYDQFKKEFVGKKMRVKSHHPKKECLCYKENINIRYQKKLVDRIESFCELFGIFKDNLIIYFPTERSHPLVVYNETSEEKEDRFEKPVLLIAPLKEIRKEKYPIDELVLKKLKNGG